MSSMPSGAVPCDQYFLGVLEAMKLFSQGNHALPSVDPMVLSELRGVLNNYMANLMGRHHVCSQC